MRVDRKYLSQIFGLKIPEFDRAIFKIGNPKIGP
jgi:hypothetical protein